MLQGDTLPSSSFGSSSELTSLLADSLLLETGVGILCRVWSIAIASAAKPSVVVKISLCEFFMNTNGYLLAIQSRSFTPRILPVKPPSSHTQACALPVVIPPSKAPILQPKASLAPYPNNKPPIIAVRIRL